MKTKGVGRIDSSQSEALRFIFAIFSGQLELFPENDNHFSPKTVMEINDTKKRLWAFMSDYLNVKQRKFELIGYHFGASYSTDRDKGTLERGVTFKIKLTPTGIAYYEGKGLVEDSHIREDVFDVRVLMIADCGEWNTRRVVFLLNSEQFTYYLQKEYPLKFTFF